MSKQVLTDAFVRTVSAGQGARLEVADAKVTGLRLRVTEKGSKSWAYCFRDAKAGKVNRLTIGPYPAVTLKAAREAATKFQTSRVENENPHALKRAEKAASKTVTSITVQPTAIASVTTFDAVAVDYIERYAKRRKTSWRNDDGYLKRARLAFGDRELKTIGRKDVTKLLDDIATEAPVSANRTQSVLHTLFAWAEPLHDLPANPVAGLKRRGAKEKAKERALDDVETRKLIVALDAKESRTARPIRLALKMILLTFARPGEVSGMTVDELHDLDGNMPEWRLPPARVKNRCAHVVPLSPAAVAVIREALSIERPDDGGRVAVFCSKWDRTASLARHSLSQATRRIATDAGVAPFTPHDLRRTSATIARRIGVRRDVVKALLNHAEGDVTSVYDRYDLSREKRDAVNLIWEKFVITS